MNLFQNIGNAILGFAEGTVLPWLENLLKNVEHDTVTTILPDVEAALTTAGVAATTDLMSGDSLSASLTAAGAALSKAAPGIVAKAETVTLQDVFTAAAAVAANASVAAKAAAAAPAPVPPA